jgi:hypothetical protein
MPSDRIEPPVRLPWPQCASRARVLGEDMTCDLPAHHEHDGQQMHHDPVADCNWSIVLTMNDGTEDRV